MIVFSFVAWAHELVVLIRLACEVPPLRRQFDKLTLHVSVFCVDRKLLYNLRLLSVAVAACHPSDYGGSSAHSNPRP